MRKQRVSFVCKTIINKSCVLKIVQKFTYFISFWYVGKASTQEEFKAVADDLDPQPIVKNAPEVKVEVKFEAGAEVAEKA